VAHPALATGQRLRLRILARDVSLARERPSPSSILNLLPVTLIAEMAAENPAHVLVRLDLQGTPLLARITRYSRDQLQLQPGQPLWAQIKSVALLA
jgi:molybdate transport system ATP-binding protein